MSPEELKLSEKSTSSEALFQDAEAAQKEKVYILDDALDMIGFGKVQIEILFVFGVLLMMVVNETMGMSIITIASQCDFNTNSQQKAFMGTACVIGILLASYFMGYLSDTYGRRTVLLRSTIVALICSTVSMFVSNLWLFIILRFFTGIGVSGASATIYAFLGEFNTPKYRPAMINYASVFVGISTMYTPGFGKVQIEISLLTGTLLMFIINETNGMGLITLASQCDFNTSAVEKSLLNAACFSGILVAAFPWGYLSDSVGRRPILIRASMVSVLISFMSMFISNFWVFVVLRFLLGIGMGGAVSTVYPYLGEFNVLRYRAVAINYASVFVGLSAIYSPGLILAAYPLGHLADILGRKRVLLGSAIFATIFSCLSMFIWNKWLYILCRFLVGFGISGLTSALYPYLGEFFAMRYRPAVINYATIPLGLSLIYCSAVAWIILPQTWSFSFFGLFNFRPWRLLILFNLLPGLIGAIWIWILPETPKLYLSHGKDAEALKVLYWIYEKNTGKPSKDFEVKRLVPEADKEFMQTIQAKKTSWQIAKSMWKQTLPLFMPPHVLNYLVCCFVMFGLFFSSSGMGLWYPEIQNRLGLGTVDSQKTICAVINEKLNETIDESSTALVCNDEISSKTYIDSITLGTSYVVAYLLLGLVINPLGRKTVLAGALGISGLCGLALQWVDEPVAIVVLFCGYLMLSGLCVSVLSGSVVDLIPTHLRGKAVCICLMVGRLGSVVGNNIIGAALEDYCEVTFYIFSGLIIVCSLLTLILPV